MKIPISLINNQFIDLIDVDGIDELLHGMVECSPSTKQIHGQSQQ